MDIFKTLFEGNNAILLLLALLLFKDQIFSLLKPKPATPAVPLPGPQQPSPVVVTPDRPVLDVVTQLLPVILPLIVQMLEKQKQEQPK